MQKELLLSPSPYCCFTSTGIDLSGAAIIKLLAFSQHEQEESLIFPGVEWFIWGCCVLIGKACFTEHPSMSPFVSGSSGILYKRTNEL